MIVWAQRNVALTRPGGDPLPSARALFTAVAPLVASGRSTGEIELFFFQRKAPDVRLRFGSSADAGDLDDAARALDEALAATDAVLDHLVAIGTLDRWFSAPYEPEVRKFGGPGTADAVHRHFDAETRLWLAAQRLDDEDGPLADPSALDVATTSAEDLFVRVLGDRDEVWDTWANLVDLAGEPDPNAPMPRRLQLDEPAGPLASSLAAASADHTAFATALAAELEAGRLRVGPRAILPFVAQLDFQRWGLSGPQQAAAATAMMAAWDPNQELRGR